jgi:hypothetical protein
MTARRFAEGTTVAPENSRAEIEKMLVRAGATKFGQGWDGSNASITCVLKGRTLRFRVELPEAASTRPKDQAKREAEIRRRWRAVALIVKAKLEAASSEVYTFDEVFMTEIVLPNRQTVGEWLGPQIADAYQGGPMPLALGPVGDPQ